MLPADATRWHVQGSIMSPFVCGCVLSTHDMSTGMYIPEMDRGVMYEYGKRIWCQVCLDVAWLISDYRYWYVLRSMS